MQTERHPSRRTLTDLVETYQASGRYVLLRKDALRELRVTGEALKKAVHRLVAKRRLAVPHRGFYVIVPIEYRDRGSPPASWFIDDLMRFCDQPYYVGLLSAAALHGAAHHQPQEFQVITKVQQRPAKDGLSRIRFFRKRRLECTSTIDVKTETGTMRVATPEATAFDLFRYLKGAGHLGHVATVLAELAEKMDAKRLVKVAKSEGELANAQRLGYVLERIGATNLATALSVWILEHRPRYVPLRVDRSVRRAKRDARFRILVNEAVEAET